MTSEDIRFVTRTRREVLGVPIDVVSPRDAVRRIASWSSRRECRLVCVCNVHSVITATREPSFHDVVSSADLSTPDGAPVAWMLRRLGAPGQRRVNGPDLMRDFCAYAAATADSIFLYGSTESTLAALQSSLLHRWPTLHIAGALSPPFRALTAQEDDDVVRRINASGASTVWVSLGCPKQELWMAAHRDHIRAVMIGVGAAFDFHAGTLPRAPRWMRESGFEWLHRLCSEPRRLWKRYLATNTVFVLAAARQLLNARRR